MARQPAMGSRRLATIARHGSPEGAAAPLLGGGAVVERPEHVFAAKRDMVSLLSEQLVTGCVSADSTGDAVLYRYLRSSDDLEALTELLHAAYAPLAAAGMRFVASFQDVEVTRRRLSRGETIVAVVNAALVGTITVKAPGVTTGSPFYNRADVAGVGQFAVAPMYQRRGIGTVLGSLVEARASEMGARYLALDTSERATHLIQLYEARGFRHVETVQWEGVNYRSVVMAKLVASGTAGSRLPEPFPA